MHAVDVEEERNQEEQRFLILCKFFKERAKTDERFLDGTFGLGDDKG
jgi:hypothetical protein